jgi:lipopolysaccharide assembly outer membrane protein LptD (OstA)
MMKSFGLIRKQIILILLIILFLPPQIFPQEDNELSQSGNNLLTETEEEIELTAEEVAQAEALKVTEMDIRTSTLSELADWNRSLGLSEGGNRQELDRRLREHYGIADVEEPIPMADGEADAKKTIIIESARSTEYFTLEVVDEEYARLKGNVVISLKDGEDVHRIKAWEITYNRTRNTMTAQGGVEYQKESGDSLETFKGDSLTVNLDTWGGIFTGGASERSMTDSEQSANDEGETAYRFEGEVISRSGDEVTVLQDAIVTNAKNEESYWSINASKIWLMPGSDWAIFNAVLKVGEIPLLYIPFFFLPADEIVFHPVIGTRTREGSFFQTTTYILGRPKASEATEQSITTMLGASNDMEKTREGLFLRSTGKKSRDPNDTRLSILFDAYANLGFYLGTELELPKIGVLDNFLLSAGIGLTRDVYEASPEWYTPFAPNYDGSSNWNSSKLFSLELPFRYRLETSGEISGAAGNLSWDLPMYSDPFAEQDFMNRSEEMDFVSMLEGNTETEEDLNDEILNSYEMRLSGSSSPPIKALNPYISRISISNISSFLTFQTRNAPDYTSSVSPQRTFYYPDKFTLVSFNGSISGTPFTFGNTSSSTKENDESESALTNDPSRSFGIPRSPWDEISIGEEAVQEVPSLNDLVPPILSQTFTIPSSDHLPKITLGYSLNPSGAVEMQFNSSSNNWKEAEDVDLNDVSSVLSLARLNGKIDVTASDPLNYYTLNFGLSGDGSWRDYNYIDKKSDAFNTDAKIDRAKENNYRSSFITSASELSATVRPLPQHAVWANSNVKYTLKNIIAETEFDGTAADPDWKLITPSWDDEGIAAHKITTNIAANVWDKNQSFVLDADLPPRDAIFTTTANLRFWYSETYINGKIRNPFEEKPIYDPYTFTETLRFNTDEFLRYSMVYNPQDDQITSISTGLGFRGLTANFSAEYITPYFFDNDPNTAEIGWKLSSDEKELVPKDFTLGYNKIFNMENLWKNRISFSIDVGADIKFDLQRYTYSSFNFDLGITLSIKDFLDISFRAQSANSVIYRYVQDLPFFSLPVDIPGEKNIVKDLINSFRFDNEDLRKSSGFKLRELALDLTHYMGDWNLNLNINLGPYLDMSKMPFSYKFNPEISFLVTWIPISEIKSEIKHDKDIFTFR